MLLHQLRGLSDQRARRDGEADRPHDVLGLELAPILALIERPHDISLINEAQLLPLVVDDRASGCMGREQI